jgi:hypothetical protein
MITELEDVGKVYRKVAKQVKAYTNQGVPLDLATRRAIRDIEHKYILEDYRRRERGQKSFNWYF